MINLKKLFLGIIITLITCSVTGCIACNVIDQSTKSIKDQGTGTDFYEELAGWDYKRIALIEPYQAINTNKSWYIETHTDSTIYQDTIGRIAKINVIDKVIITYSLNTTYKGKVVDELWYVIIPDKNIEQGFLLESEFLAWFRILES